MSDTLVNPSLELEAADGRAFPCIIEREDTDLKYRWDYAGLKAAERKALEIGAPVRLRWRNRPDEYIGGFVPNAEVES